LNDLEKVVQHVERRQREAEEEQARAKEELAQIEIANDWRRSNLVKLDSRLREFARNVRSKVGIYLSVNDHRICISISKTHPLLRKPFRTIDVFPASDSQDFHFDVRSIGESKLASGRVQSFDELVDIVANEVAAYIEANGIFEFALPTWYLAVGTVFGWIFFVLILLLSTMMFGFWGFILGAVVGAFAIVAGEYFWLPILVLAVASAFG
jgi:hypothetical protein